MCKIVAIYEQDTYFTNNIIIMYIMGQKFFE